MIIVLYYKEYHSEYILYIIELYFRDGFLILFLAVILGGALALIKKNKITAFIIFLIVALTTEVRSVFYTRIFTEGLGNSFTEPLLTVFDVLLPARKGDYGYAGSSYRIQLILAWVLLFAFINLIGYFNTKKVLYRTVSALTAIGCIASFIMFSLPASRFLTFGVKNNVYFNDSLYYSDNEDKIKTEKADFNVTDYDISFKIKRNLSAEATLTLDKKELSEYKFTLYHGYKVKRITDGNGKELKFTRDYDYITVYSESTLNKIKMFYSGSGGAHYSDSQRICLPGWFPFYPQSGCKEIYYNYGIAYLDCTLDEKANFHIKIDTPKRVFTNLDEISPNEFSGYTEGLTMVSGFYEQTDINGISFVYPYLERKFEDFDEEKDEISACINNGVFPTDTKKIIIIRIRSSSLTAGPIKVYSDYVNTNSLDAEFLKNVIFRNKIGAKRIGVYELLLSYKNDRKYYDSGYIAWAKAVFGDEYLESEYGLFDECMKKYGLKFMDEKCTEFWESETEERDGRQFLRDLLENGA